VESRVPSCLETVPGKCTSPTKNIDQHRDKNAKINRQVILQKDWSFEKLYENQLQNEKNLFFKR